MEKKHEKYIDVENKNYKKASEKHKQLASFIKEIHAELRSESEIHGVEEAWKKHITKNEKLKTYAECMYELANEHWIQESKNIAPFTYCRIEWIKKQCKDYFLNGGMKKFDDKEEYLLNKECDISNISINTKKIMTIIETKINILDVGSCYNPFNGENLFSVTAIDIAPYSSNVTKCDFLNLKIDKARVFSQDEVTLIELPKNSFDAVIFSLFLEYFPCPKQRYLCCKKVYDLLKDGGILFIATPDSKHEGANKKIINISWKVVLAKLGFMRIHYQKLRHIHCIIFRKCFYREVPVKQINWKKIPNDDELYFSTKIFIPQDFHQSNLKKDSSQTQLTKFEHNDQELISLFNELPNDD